MTRLHKEIQSEKSDDMVRSFTMYMYKITRDKVKEVDDMLKKKQITFVKRTQTIGIEEPYNYNKSRVLI